MIKIISLLLVLAVGVNCQYNTHFLPSRSGIVELTEWKFGDIAAECENFLGPKSFGGIQISPITENVVSANRSWWERYQPVSYKIISRSGNEGQFKDMVYRCNAAGIRVFVDIVLNQMAGPIGNETTDVGTGGSTGTPGNFSYPGVPYTKNNFHSPCNITNYQDATQVRNCQINGQPDLNQANEYVRKQIVGFMNKLIGYGVTGFRVAGSQYMSPDDLKVIYGRLNYLNQSHSFWAFSRPFIYQQVVDLQNDQISKSAYSSLGVVSEFLYSAQIANVFRGEETLSSLQNFGSASGFAQSNQALVSIDDETSQRGSGVLTYKDRKQYTQATIFMMAHPYGIPRIMSSYDFSDNDQGPPADSNGAITSPLTTTDRQCQNGWICEHRWLPIVNMIDFQNTVGIYGVIQFQTISDNQIAFCRGYLGFVAINNDATEDFNAQVQTCLPIGTYCDLANGQFAGYKCTGRTVTVGWFGLANINIPANDTVGAIVLHYKAVMPVFPTLS